MASFPPIGGGELAVCGGVVAKLQTHWVKRLQKRLVLAEWVCTLAATPPQLAAPPPLNGGNDAIQGSDTPTTRR